MGQIHMEKSRGEKSCLILSNKPSSFTRRVLCGSYTHGNVYRAKVLSYPLYQTIQLHKDKYYVVHIQMEKSRGQKFYMGNFLVNFLVYQSLFVLWFVKFQDYMLTTLCWLSLVMHLWHYTSLLKYCNKPTNYSYFSFIYISVVNNSFRHDLTIN